MIEGTAQFSNLDPLAASVIAVSLTYLTLPSFRYRDEASKAAKKLLSELDQLQPAEEECRTSYGRLVRFSAELASKKQKDRLAKNGSHIPDESDHGPWHGLFAIGGRLQIAWDAKIALAIAAISFFVLTVGVAQKLGFDLAQKLAHQAFIDALYFVLLALAPVPLLMIRAGRRWLRWAKEQIEHYGQEARNEIKAKIITGSIPTSAPDAPEELSPAAIEAILEQIEKVVAKRQAQAKASAAGGNDPSSASTSAAS